MNARSGARLASACLLPVLAVAEASASPPFVLDDGEVEDLGHVELDLGPLVTATKAGPQGNLIYTEADYGAFPDIETDVVAPLAFSDASTARPQVGVGDVQLEVKVRIADQSATKATPTIAFGPTLSMPTGNAARGLGTGRSTLFLPFWASRAIGCWTAFGGGGPAVELSASRRDYVQVGAGLERALTDGWAIGGELYETTAQGPSAPASPSLDVDVTRELTTRALLFASIGRSFGPGASTNRVDVFAGLQITR